LRIIRRAEARDSQQQFGWIDIGSDLAHCHSGLQQTLERRPKPLLKIDRQRLKRWITRVQRRRQAALGRDEINVALEPAIKRITGPIFGCEERRRVCAGVDFSTKDGRDEVGALGKVAVNSPDADAGFLGDLSDRSVHSRGCEHRQRRLEQSIDVALGVGARPSIHAAARV
jgi:hypothetical protein